MNSSDATARTPAAAPHPPGGSPTPAVAALIGFLEARLREDLARIWERGDPAGPGRPGMAAQVAVVDALLRILAAGGLPIRAELRVLLFGYGSHRDFDPGWYEVLLGR